MMNPAAVGMSFNSVSTETPLHAVSSFDHLVTQWMSTVTSSAGSPWSSSHVHVRGSSTRPVISNRQASSWTLGVGPADRTGKSGVTYWPGGMRPLGASASRRPRNPLEMKPIVLPSDQGALPPVTHRSKRSTCALGHAPSQGIVPALRRSRMASACSLTSSADQRSKANSIDLRSRSRNNGLTSISKLTGAVAIMPSFRTTEPAKRPPRLFDPSTGSKPGLEGVSSELSEPLDEGQGDLGNLAPAVVDGEGVAP